MKELAKHLIRQGYLYVGGEKTIEASMKFGKKYKYKPDLEVFDLTKYTDEKRYSLQLRQLIRFLLFA